MTTSRSDSDLKSFLDIMAPIQNIRPVAGGLTAIVLGLGVATAATPVEVAVSAARPQAVATGFEFDGVVEPVKQSTISAQTTGRIATLLVKAGDKVRAGQLLATIDDRETQTGVARSQAQVAQADAELRNASAHVARLRELQKKGFVSQAALDTAESQFKGAQAGRRRPVPVRNRRLWPKAIPVCWRHMTDGCCRRWPRRAIWRYRENPFLRCMRHCRCA